MAPKNLTKIKGLPYQTVEFQFMARKMRAAVENVEVSELERTRELNEVRKKMHQMVEDNAYFWLEQI